MDIEHHTVNPNMNYLIKDESRDYVCAAYVLAQLRALHRKHGGKPFEYNLDCDLEPTEEDLTAAWRRLERA